MKKTLRPAMLPAVRLICAKRAVRNPAGESVLKGDGGACYQMNDVSHTIRGMVKMESRVEITTVSTA